MPDEQPKYASVHPTPGDWLAAERIAERFRLQRKLPWLLMTIAEAREEGEEIELPRSEGEEGLAALSGPEQDSEPRSPEGDSEGGPEGVQGA